MLKAEIRSTHIHSVCLMSRHDTDPSLFSLQFEALCGDQFDQEPNKDHKPEGAPEPEGSVHQDHSEEYSKKKSPQDSMERPVHFQATCSNGKPHYRVVDQGRNTDRPKGYPRLISLYQHADTPEDCSPDGSYYHSPFLQFNHLLLTGSIPRHKRGYFVSWECTKTGGSGLHVSQKPYQ